MSTYFKNIFSISMVLLLLVSFTGMQLLVHHCFSCDTTKYQVLNTHSGCSDHENKTGSCCPVLAHIPTCCEVSTKSDSPEIAGCCFDELIYLKNDFEASYERNEFRISPLEVILPWQEYLETNLLPHPTDINFITHSKSPPVILVGKDFLVSSHQLKIAQI